MKIGIAVPLQIIRAANPCITHDRRAAPRFICGAGISISTAAITRNAVKTVTCPELVAHFMRHVINVKGITSRHRHACLPASFAPVLADNSQCSYAASTGPEHMSDIVILAADDCVNVDWFCHNNP